MASWRCGLGATDRHLDARSLIHGEIRPTLAGAVPNHLEPDVMHYLEKRPRSRRHVQCVRGDRRFRNR